MKPLQSILAGGLLAVMLGIVTLAVMVGRTWTPENTSTLITAATVAFGAGVVMFGVAFGVFAGLAVWRAAMRTTGNQERRYAPPPLATWEEPRPPQLPANGGRYIGAQSYDLWPADDAEEAEYAVLPALPYRSLREPGR